jgi:hypothetical protein
MKQGEHSVRERQFLVDAVLGQFADAGLDVVGRRARQVVILHQDTAEVLRQERLSLREADHVGAVLVPDPRRLILQLFRELLVEDVVGDGDVVVGGEDLGPRRQAGVTRGVPATILGRAEAAGRVERACCSGHRWHSNHQVTGSSYTP